MWSLITKNPEKSTSPIWVTNFLVCKSRGLAEIWFPLSFLLILIIHDSKNTEQSFSFHTYMLTTFSNIYTFALFIKSASNILFTKQRMHLCYTAFTAPILRSPCPRLLPRNPAVLLTTEAEAISSPSEFGLSQVTCFGQCYMVGVTVCQFQARASRRLACFHVPAGTCTIAVRMTCWASSLVPRDGCEAPNDLSQLRCPRQTPIDLQVHKWAQPASRTTKQQPE